MNKSKFKSILLAKTWTAFLKHVCDHFDRSNGNHEELNSPQSKEDIFMIEVDSEIRNKVTNLLK